MLRSVAVLVIVLLALGAATRSYAHDSEHKVLHFPTARVRDSAAEASASRPGQDAARRTPRPPIDLGPALELRWPRTRLLQRVGSERFDLRAPSAVVDDFRQARRAVVVGRSRARQRRSAEAPGVEQSGLAQALGAQQEDARAVHARLLRLSDRRVDTRSTPGLLTLLSKDLRLYRRELRWALQVVAEHERISRLRARYRAATRSRTESESGLPQQVNAALWEGRYPWAASAEAPPEAKIQLGGNEVAVRVGGMIVPLDATALPQHVLSDVEGGRFSRVSNNTHQGLNLVDVGLRPVRAQLETLQREVAALIATLPQLKEQTRRLLAAWP
jgi:hypothetical protein